MDSRKITTRNGSDIAFTSLGLGTGPLGELFRKLDEKTSIATVEAAFAKGVRVFDTSPHYGCGLAESRLGAGLRGVPRNDLVVSTKVGRIMDPRGEKPKPVPGVVSFAGGYPHAARFDYSYDGAMRSIEHSLLRLGLERLDIVMIHDCDRWTHGAEGAPRRFKEAMEGAYVALDTLRSEKVIKGVGFGINEADTCVKFAKAGDFDVGMMAGRYSLLDQSGLQELLPLAQSKNIAIMLAGVFNSGILATGAVTHAKYEYADATPEVLDKVRQLEALCAAQGVSIRQAAIQFAGMHPAVVSVVLGAITPEEIVDNIRDAGAHSSCALGRNEDGAPSGPDGSDPGLGGPAVTLPVSPMVRTIPLPYPSWSVQGGVQRCSSKINSVLTREGWIPDRLGQRRPAFQPGSAPSFTRALPVARPRAAAAR